MSRISVPKLEVIHFSAEDVIVTSGTIDPTYNPKFAKNSNLVYVSSGDELYHGGYRNCLESSWYSFKYDNKGNSGFTSITEWTLDSESAYYYAWYKDLDNEWVTEPRQLRKYYSGYPTD